MTFAANEPRRVVMVTLVVHAAGWDDEQIATAIAEDLRMVGWPPASVSMIDPDVEDGQWRAHG